MATLYISEYADVARLAAPGRLIDGIVEEPPLEQQTVAIAGASAQSAAFGDTTNLIKIHTDAICSILVGADPTAAATHRRLPANHTELMAVTPGHKIAVISNT